MLALGYALDSGEKEILLLGVDCLQDDYMSPGNVYEGTGGSYEDKYTEEDEKLWIKRMKDLGFEGELFLKFNRMINDRK